MDSSTAAATAEVGVAVEAPTATATCACCGIGEECTAQYVDTVAAQFSGAWVCGEAIKDEAATRAHAEFVGTARSGPAAQVTAAAPGAAVLPPAAHDLEK